MDNATLAMMGREKGRKVQEEGSERRIAASEAKLRDVLLKGKEGEAAEQISKDIAALGKQMRAPGKDIQRVIATFAAKYGEEFKEARGAVIGELGEAADVQRLLRTGHLLDQASVKSQQDLLGKLADAFVVFEGMPGRPEGMNLMNREGLVKEAFENKFGEEATRAADQAARGLMQVQEELINRVQESVKPGGKLSAGDAAMLQRMNITGTGDKAVEELKKLFHEGDLMKGFTAVFNAMDESSKEAIAGAKSQLDYQKETATFQSDITDKINNLSEHWMAQLAEWLKKILDAVIDIYESLPGWLSGKKDLKEVQRVAEETKNPAIIAAYKDAKSVSEGSSKLLGTVGKDVVEGIQKAIKEYKELDAKVKTERDPEKKKAMLNRMKELRAVAQYEKMSRGSLAQDHSTKGADVVIGKLVKAKEALDRIKPAAAPPAPAAAAPATAPAAPAPVAPPAPTNARGGTVTGIIGGMAQVRRAAPGEGLASVGRGERIIPAGRGGVTVQLELKGDLKRFIQARVVEGAAAHDRNKRLR